MVECINYQNAKFEKSDNVGNGKMGPGLVPPLSRIYLKFNSYIFTSFQVQWGSKYQTFKFQKQLWTWLFIILYSDHNSFVFSGEVTPTVTTLVAADTNPWYSINQQ